MKKMTRLIMMVLGLVLSFGAYASDEPVPGIFGLTAEDPKPEGCVNCHKIIEDKDRRLITKESVQAIEKHRESRHFAEMETMPGSNEQGCISCHENFGTLMHDKHFGNTKENHFVGKYFAKVGCLACHAFEQTEEDGLGIISKQGKINWSNEDFKAILEENLY